ncbi:MAG: [FeFe] hydrogenase H-cluster maturation GTPase HydF, partial [Oscillospiraceae bacterium]
AVVLFNDSDITIESEWIKKLQKRTIPFLACITKKDLGENKELYEKIKTQFGVTPLYFSASDEVLKENLIKKLISLVPEDFGTQSITAKLVSENEHVLLVMPQDLQAPKGRLILPQVQTIRDLLDNKCIVTSCTLTSLEKALSLCKEPPSLIITDSQIFKEVYEMKSEKSRLTSFSVLFAQYKGDINEFISGANALNSLGEHAKILIAESCTHVP